MDVNNALPLLWEAKDYAINDLPELLKTEAGKIKELLLLHGAVLFKSFGIDSAEKLEACVNAFPGKSLNYVDGNSPRTRLQDKVYTSTEYPASEFISLHNELSYGKNWPRFLFFCCVTPALKGGSTVLADSRAMLNGLSAEVQEAFRSKGVMYIRNLHGGYGAGNSWQETFETDDRSVVEEYCRQDDIMYEWNSDDSLRLLQKRDGVIRHPESGVEVWFNQADQFHPSTHSADVYEALMEVYEGDPMSMPQYATFGDGDEIPLFMLEEIREAGKKTMVAPEWEKGDLMLVDNILTAHGRMPFEGARKILVSMLA
ncbi:MAG: TauD/TfdA family dioxygenase [Dinghuibacter sp.]|nr:TauD/TfdA family dioxygenase [Dinghuibacter sp.]